MAEIRAFRAFGDFRDMNKLGKGFSDSITRQKAFGHLGGGIKKGLRRGVIGGRIVPYFVIFVLGIGILGWRLFWVTIVRGEHYRELSEGNRVREEVLWAPRGIVYDRHGEALVHNRPVYRVTKEESGYVGYVGRVGKDANYAYLSQEEVLELEAKGEGKGIELFISREYPLGGIAAHVVGYVGEADREDVENGLRLGSLVGKTGLEDAYDGVLRGEEGKALVEYDAVGGRVRELGRIEPTAGSDLYTTLDKDLQISVANIFVYGQARSRFEVQGSKEQKDNLGEEKAGAVVVGRPDGEILALYSSPSFDANKLLGSLGDLGSLGVEEILGGEGRAMFNRAIGGLYPPGSVFKPIVAIAALEEGAIDGGTVFEDKGVIRVGEFLFRNWYYTQYGRVEGEVDVIKGIARSVDTFFYQVGEEVGIDGIEKWGEKFGIGRASGIGIAGEASGRMPGREWKEEAKGERWYLGDTYHTAIGQGDVLVTPLQVNMFTGAIANGGKLCRPRLISPESVLGDEFFRGDELGLRQKLSHFGGPPANISRPTVVDGSTATSQPTDGGRAGLRQPPPAKKLSPSDLSGECEDLGISGETLELVRKGMRRACEAGGTGFEFFEFKVQGSRFAGVGDGRIPVACKTGTAEFGEKDKTHAWFTVFAPVENPEIVVTVLLERGGSGAYDAAPVAKEILEEYFNDEGGD